jgi:hypothetical protein
MKICPTCHREIPDPKRPKRVCARCGQQIRTHHKWEFGEDGRPVHRNCDVPDSYHGVEETRQQLEQKQMNLEERP